jgi:hypothetical protein
VQNTLTEYARFVIGHVGHVATNFWHENGC